MMGNQEKEIVKLRNEGKYAEHKSIYNDYTMIGERRYIFTTQSIYTRVHMMLPEDFIDLPLNFAKAKYPSEGRPKVIKSSIDTMINFAFLYKEPTNQEQLPYAARGFAAAIQKLNPSHVFMESGAVYIGSRKEKLLCWYEYLSPDFKGKIYNQHGYLAMEGRLLQVLFNCPESLYPDWKPVALEAAESIYSDLENQF